MKCYDMDFIKREGQNLLDEEAYKAYAEALQKQQQQLEISELQQAAISMEHLHQAMQSSFSSTLNQNFQMPISPRQMSSLMLKTNHLSRNFHFSDLTRNLNEAELQNLAHEVSLTQNVGRTQEEIINQNLVRINDIVVKNFGDIDLQQIILAQTLNGHIDMRSLEHNDLNLNHELDLSQHLNRNVVMDKNPTVICESIEEERSNPIMPHTRLDPNHIPMPFTIKSEQEDEACFYDTLQQGYWGDKGTVNGHQGQIHMAEQANPPIHQDHIYSYNAHTSNASVPPLDLYPRTQNYVQNYVTVENPQNLVIHKHTNSPYTGDIQDCEDPKSGKDTEPKENLKPNKVYFNEYEQVQYDVGVKSNDTKTKKPIEEHSVDIKGEYICYKCNEIFPSKRGLKQHTKLCADSENNEVEKTGKFSCSQCPYRCQSPAILKIHERTHTGEKPFSCTFCDYKSGQKNNVAKHILVHMKEKPFRCQYCEYRCAQKNNLVVHERTHTGYKPFACPYCDYRTVQKPNLVKHMYLHTDQKPFSCDICNYRCVQKTNLMKHKQRHMSEKDTNKIDFPSQVKPYRPRQKSLKCPHCTYRCVQKVSLEKHMQFKHDGMENSVDISEHYEEELNLMKNVGEEDVQNLSKKDGHFSDACDDKPEETLDIS